MDWVATFFAAAGVGPHPGYPLDGASLLPVLRNSRSRFDRALFWRMKHRDQRALREGQWKYLAIGANEYLFDVEADERERANLAERHPDRLAAMRSRYTEWNASMPSVPEDARVSLIYTEKDMP
jgi:arylsulfatase A-like enzyme